MNKKAQDILKTLQIAGIRDDQLTASLISIVDKQAAYEYLNELDKVSEVGFEAGVIPPTNTIENIDCMEMLKKCPDKHFDLAIVDPPYGNNLSGGRSAKDGWNPNIDWDKCNKGWNVEIPKQEYFTQLQRVSKNQIIWGGNYFANMLPNTECWIVWDKGQRNFSLADGELAWCSFDKALRIIEYPRALANQEDKIHPTQKPVELYKKILLRYAKQGDLILDTHVGSGSSIVACIEGGFNYYGCEIDKDYYDAARRRIARAFRHYELNFNNESAV